MASYKELGSVCNIFRSLLSTTRIPLADRDCVKRIDLGKGSGHPRSFRRSEHSAALPTRLRAIQIKIKIYVYE